MNRFIAAFLTAAAVSAAAPVFAQDAAPGPGRVVITVTEAEDNPSEPSFGNYELGGSVTVNFNRYVGVEGEVSGGIGVSQGLQFGSAEVDERSPNLLNYNANLVLSAANRTSIVPYLTGGVGGMTMFERASLSVNDVETFLTGNVGGGLAWYAGRWGLRADYRFIAVQSKDDAPSFFGAEERYGHRLYAGVLLNVGR
jgi:hypothetical protein